MSFPFESKPLAGESTSDHVWMVICSCIIRHSLNQWMCPQEEASRSQAGLNGQLAKMRNDVQSAHTELQKSHEQVSQMLEDVISHVHSPIFASQVTADCLKAVEQLRQELDGVKHKSSSGAMDRGSEEQVGIAAACSACA